MIMDEVTPFLPEEIIRNILIRLPVKSLVRFRCVCKHWKNLIKSPSFISDHLHHSTHQNPSLLLQPKREGKLISQLHLLDREMQVLDLPTVPLFDDSRFRVKGSCNGLLCVEINGQGTYPPPLLLCNPATRDVMMLPRTVGVDYFESECYLGFGFSPTVNDYKMVRTYGDRKDCIYQVEVYSLITGSWKEIDCDFLDDTRILSDAVTANGYMFWTGLLLDWDMVGDGVGVIVSFDIATEELKFVPIPELGNDPMYELMVYEDKLAIFDHTRDAEPGCMFDVWVMEEDEEKRSWSKIFSGDCSAVCLWVPAIFWKGDFVYNVHEVPVLGGEAEDGIITVLFLLNVSTNEMKIFTTRRCGDWDAGIFNYAESLVPLG